MRVEIIFDEYSLHINKNFVIDTELSIASVAAAVRAESAADRAEAGAISNSTSGSIASFPDGADGLPVKDLVVGIEPVQSGSGDPSPSNVRPITGRTGCEVVLSPTEDAEDGTTYTVSWASEAGTVYGGSVDVVSGVLTVTHKAYVITDTSVLTDATSSDPGFRVRFNGHTANDTTTALRPYQLCSHASVVANAGNIGSKKGAGFQVYPSNTYIYLYLGAGYDTLQATKDYCQAQITNGTPVTFLWELANPLTYNLTPTEVTTLLGQNNVWADCGDAEVTYRADTKLYIDGKTTDWAKLIAPVEVALKATRAYSTGNLLIVDSQLYKATASIANGATLTIGTNITATTLAEVIAAL